MKIAARPRPSSSGGPPVQALLLRRWALHLLGSAAGPSADLWEGAARCGSRGWELFLAHECCALALQSRLERLGAWDRLPEHAATLIRERATPELQRVLSARAQLRLVGRLAASNDWRVIVLKGGVAAAGGEFIELGDVDILVAPELAMDVAAALEQAGFERSGHEEASPYHLAGRVTPNALPIEVHHTLEDGGQLSSLFGSATEMPGEPTLWRQGAVDHLCHLLHHSTIRHPERIGRIRDLLLLGHALRTSTPAEIAAVEAEIAEHEAGATLIDLLRLARQFEAGEFSSDPFGAAVMRTILLMRRRWWLAESRGGMTFLTYAAWIVVRGRRHWWGAYRHLRVRPLPTISSTRVLARLERRSHLLADAARQGLRVLAFGIATTYALIVEAEARWVELKMRSLSRTPSR